MFNFLKLSGKMHPKYISYMKWSFLTNVCVSAESALVTHNMLQVVGLQNDLIRTINYIGKDVIGQIGGLAYMSKMATSADKKPGKFLLYSHVIQQASFLLTFATPLFPAYFLPIAGTSNILTNISFTGYGALNAKAIQELAVDGGVGEIYAKITGVNTLGSSIGLGLGIGLTALIPSYTARLMLIPCLAAVRIYSFNKALSGLVKV